MKFKKTVLLFVLSLVFLVSASAAYATDTWYDIGYGNTIDAYGYGCDWGCSQDAYESSDGSYLGVTGIKIRAAVYKNGIKIVDTSKYDITSPYSVELDGSEVSDYYSNTWQLVQYMYYKQYNNTSYTYLFSATANDSN